MEIPQPGGIVSPYAYATEVEARIAHLEHALMIEGHQAECPACNGRAWPLKPPKTESVRR